MVVKRLDGVDRVIPVGPVRTPHYFAAGVAGSEYL